MRSAALDPTDGDDDGEAPRPGPPGGLDGRRRHVIDRALDYAALAAAGRSDTQIARLRRKSRGYVSILRRLGQALDGLPAPEVAAFRTPRIGFALLQRLVRDGVPPAELRAQLRTAAGGFSTLTVDHRRRGLRRGGVSERSRMGHRGAGGTGGWAWDPALFQTDPLGYVRAHIERLIAIQSFVARRARQDVAVRAISGRAVGQPLAQLAAAVAAQRRRDPQAQGGGSPEEERAVAQLARLAETFASVAAEILAAPVTRPPAGGGPTRRPHEPGTWATPPRSTDGSRHRIVPLAPEELSDALDEDLA